MYALFSRFVGWVRRAVEVVYDALYELVARVPGVPFVFKRQLINEYVEMAVSASVDPTLIVAELDIAIRPWITMNQLRQHFLPIRGILAPVIHIDSLRGGNHDG